MCVIISWYLSNRAETGGRLAVSKVGLDGADPERVLASSAEDLIDSQQLLRVTDTGTW